MVKYSIVAFLALVVGVESFHSKEYGASKIIKQRKTSLEATPPLIIGPIIRKMREKQEQERMPMATPEEASQEAPGLRVGENAWKWPPIWPYDQEMFTPNEDIAEPPKSPMGALGGAMGGAMGGPGGMMDLLQEAQAPPPAETVEKETLDPLKYWGEDKADTLTEMDAEAVEKLTSHYSYYLRDGMSVLELGAAEESYLPPGLKLSRHVGIGASKATMERNSALTESYVVDLNVIDEGKGVDSDQLKKLAQEPFDIIIMANTVEYLTSPREVYKSAWYLLKPGGRMIVSFSNKEAFKSKFERAMTKMWRDYNDDQHLWICGSLFHFSAGEGFENLRGFDISPESAKDTMDKSPLAMFKGGKNNNIYVVQAEKGIQDDEIDEKEPEKSFKSKMWMLPTMEDRDKSLVTPRLGRTYLAVGPEQKEALKSNVDLLPMIYESLVKMDQFAFTFSMQSQLASDLVSDPDFDANEDQLVALKEGLGLRTPGEDFWAPVGRLTANMDIQDKINLLAYLVPRFGSGDPAQEAALQAFATGLKPTFEIIRRKCPDLSDADVELVGTEMLASEVLKAGRSTREEFAAWLGAITDTELREILSERKEVNEKTAAELAEYRKEKAEVRAKYEEQQEAMKEQMEVARKARTLTFDPSTGKFKKLKK